MDFSLKRAATVMLGHMESPLSLVHMDSIDGAEVTVRWWFHRGFTQCFILINDSNVYDGACGLAFLKPGERDNREEAMRVSLAKAVEHVFPKSLRHRLSSKIRRYILMRSLIIIHGAGLPINTYREVFLDPGTVYGVSNDFGMTIYLDPYPRQHWDDWGINGYWVRFYDVGRVTLCVIATANEYTMRVRSGFAICNTGDVWDAAIGQDKSFDRAIGKGMRWEWSPFQGSRKSMSRLWRLSK